MNSLVLKITTTTAVNAAFLQEVKESNIQLWQTLAQIKELKNSGEDSKAVARSFVRLLAQLRELIGLQFKLEETYGYIDRTPIRLVRSGLDATATRRQHCELYLQLHELSEQVEEAEYRGTITRDLEAYWETFDSFEEKWALHEEKEDELIRSSMGHQRKKA